MKVKYYSDFNKIKLSNFTELEQNLLYAITNPDTYKIIKFTLNLKKPKE
ncbi:hypothetical protein [Campylobacter sp. LH-2024]